MISRSGRMYDSFFDVFFDITVTDDWHEGPISPLLIIDPNQYPPDPGMPANWAVESFFDVFVDLPGNKQSAGAQQETLFVNTVLDDGRIIDHRDTDGDNMVSVGDFVLVVYANGESVWYRVVTTGTNGGTKNGTAVVDYFELLTAIPPETPPACACNCHADPVCDGTISNVQDVVATINVAFRGAPAIVDPNVNCPYETTDVNCDSVTSVLDVVKVVNVSFRGANPATEYCNPCP